MLPPNTDTAASVASTPPHENAMTPLDVDTLRSRLGRKLLTRFILVGLVPLVIFALPLYLQTRSILDVGTRRTLISYTKLAKGQIFTTLDGARARLDQQRRQPGSPSLPMPPFRRVLTLNRPSDGGAVGANWPELDALRHKMLEEGRIVITDPYLIDGAYTVSLMGRQAPELGGRVIVGEIEPVELWNVTRAGNYGPEDALIVLNAQGSVIATSQELLPLATRFFPAGLPESPRATGDSTVQGVDDCLWGMSDLWLAGAFGGPRWAVVALRSRREVTEIPMVLFRSLLVLLLIASCVIVILSIREARSLLLPISRVAHAAQRVAAGAWNEQVAPERDDEIGDMVRSFNSMTIKLRETHDESVRLTKEAMVGRLAAMVAHQVNTPLAAMKAKLGLLPLAHPALGRDSAVLMDQVDRIAGIVRALLGFARHRSQPAATSDVGAIIENVEALFVASLSSRGIGFSSASPHAAIRARCTPEDLQEVLVNLLENAREALAPTGVVKFDDTDAQRVKPAIRMEVSHDEHKVEITVSDNGPGLLSSPDKIFDPFFTTKTTGTGLGLAISRRICAACGGSIRAEANPGGGARFIASFLRVSETGDMGTGATAHDKRETSA